MNYNKKRIVSIVSMDCVDGLLWMISYIVWTCPTGTCDNEQTKLETKAYRLYEWTVWMNSYVNEWIYCMDLLDEYLREWKNCKGKRISCMDLWQIGSVLSYCMDSWEGIDRKNILIRNGQKKCSNQNW